MNLHSRIPVGFTWDIETVRDGKVIAIERAYNRIPVEGLNHLGSVSFKQGVQVPAWYIGLYEGNYTPLADATAATIVAAATETTAYDESARQEWIEGAMNAGSCDNSANKAVFTFNAEKTIYGGFLISSSPKASGTGVLMSLVRFPSPKTPTPGDVLRVVAGVAFASA